MRATIISERHNVTVNEHELCFYKPSDPHGPQYGFNCDEYGTVREDLNSASAFENYLRLKDDPEWTSYPWNRSWSYTENAKAVCPECGRTFELWDELMGACQCECGQWYNLFGQPLLPPTEWEDEGYDEEYDY